jgi:hypothetical protein
MHINDRVIKFEEEDALATKKTSRKAFTLQGCALSGVEGHKATRCWLSGVEASGYSLFEQLSKNQRCFCFSGRWLHRSDYPIRGILCRSFERRSRYDGSASRGMGESA